MDEIVNKGTVNPDAKPVSPVPVTIPEIENRVQAVTEELTRGLNRIKDYGKSVTFFGSARFLEENIYYQKARHLAHRISSELGYAIITGGGPGIMEAANRGANEAGGASLGLTIKLPMEQVTNPYLTAEESFHYFFNRKVCMTFAAEAYVFFPGGFGTYDEFFEILTLVQTGKIEPVPIILVDTEFWNQADVGFKDVLLKYQTIDDRDLKWYTITDDEDLILDIIKNAPIRTGSQNPETLTPKQ